MIEPANEVIVPKRIKSENPSEIFSSIFNHIEMKITNRTIQIKLHLIIIPPLFVQIIYFTLKKLS